jgi:pimeloyl-ACP methyl ester carboxylesterase
MGGPGEGAIDDAAGAASQFADLGKNRDILLVDQRGTGQSEPLHCSLFTPDNPAANLIDLFPEDAVQACARRLGARTDLTRFTYAYAAHDLEQIRRGLGYGPMNLVAFSYGTRAAQVYMRDYPQSVRTAYLGSVVPVDLPIPLTFARTAQAALDRMTADCEENPACRAAFPDLRKDVENVFAQLEGDQLRVSLPGRPQTAALGRGRVAEWARSRLYRPAGAATLPKLFHHAARGDWSGIVDGILESSREADHALELGLLFAITCSEDVPFIREQDVPAESEMTFLGSYRLRQQQTACRPWPKSDLPSGYRRPIVTDIPTLFVTGDRDGDTPLWFTDHVAAGFARRAMLVVHGQGHTGWNECVARLHQQLVRTGTTNEIEPSCPAIALPPFLQ